MRGCFQPRRLYGRGNGVFPAHAGVFPNRACARAWRTSSSPRMRGCFHLQDFWKRLRKVFPAHAGVFLNDNVHPVRGGSLPRACGGVSVDVVFFDSEGGSSPRMRGCFSPASKRRAWPAVFPAHAGVFPSVRYRKVYGVGLPRACGGVSNLATLGNSLGKSSPRMRGCFQRLKDASSCF